MAQDWAQILADVNYWGRYRHPDPNNYVDKTLQQVKNNSWSDYREPLHQTLTGAPPVLPALGNQGNGHTLIRPPANDPDPVHQRFLDQQIHSLGIHWGSTKWLGEGGNARVGLWEHCCRFLPAPENIPMPPNTQIAVKEAKTIAGARALKTEAAIYPKFNEIGSEHIVEMVQDPEKVWEETIADEGLGPAWNNRIRRLFLEYCPLGTLHDLIDRRRRL